MARKTVLPQLSIRAVLGDLQRGFESPGHAKDLWVTCLSQPDTFRQDLLQCLLLCIQASEEYTADQGVYTFLGRWASCMPTPAAERDAAENVVSVILHQLASWLGQAEAHCRRRVLAMSCQLLHGLPRDAALQTDAIDFLASCCAALLEDRDASCRKLAAKCLQRMMYIPEGMSAMNHPHVEALLNLLEVEDKEGVRVEAVRSVPIDHDTLPRILAFTRDPFAKVAAAIYNKLAADGIEIQHLSLDQKLEVLLGGLREGRKDRREVRSAAAHLLVHWFKDNCQSDPLVLLAELVPQLYPELAEVCLEELLAAGAWDMEAWLASATADGRSLADRARAAVANLAGSGGLKGAAFMDAAEAFLCAFACVRQKEAASSKGQMAAKATGAAATAQAATAASKMDVLDDFLPSAQDLLLLIQVHAVPEQRFVAIQLMHTAAACMDWTDGPSRSAACDAIEQLIASSEEAEDEDLALMYTQPAGGARPWGQGIMALARSVMGDGGWGPSGVVTFFLPPILRLAGVVGAAASQPLPQGHALQALHFLVHLLQQLDHATKPSATGMADDGEAGEAGSAFSIAAAVESLRPVAVRSSYGRYALLRCYTLLALRVGGEAHLQSAVSLAYTLLHAMPDDLSQQLGLQALVDLSVAWGIPRIDARLAYAQKSNALQQAADDIANQFADALSFGALGQQDGAADMPGTSSPGGGLGGATAAAAGRADPWLGAGMVELLMRCTDSVVRRRVGEPEAAAAREVQADTLLGMAKLLHSQEVLGQVQRRLGVQMTMQEAHVLQLLQQLLVAYCSPSTDGHPRVRKQLARFFEVYSAGGPANQLLLARAFMPASRMALGLPLAGGAGKTAAAALLPFLCQLLQQERQPADAGAEASGDSDPARPFSGHLHLASLIMEEVKALLQRGGALPASGARAKAYISELCRVPGRLNLDASDQAGLRRLAYLARRTEDEVQNGAGVKLLTAAARKEVAAFVRSVEELLQQGVQPMGDEEADEVLKALREELEGLPALLDGDADGDGDEGNDVSSTTRIRSSSSSTATTMSRRRGTTSSTSSSATAHKAGTNTNKGARGRRMASMPEHQEEDGATSDDEDDGQEGDQHSSQGLAASSALQPTRRSSRSTATATNQRLKAAAAREAGMDMGILGTDS